MSPPNDVLDPILSILESDLTTLETCAQSHPTLSQPQIYSSVVLYNDFATVVSSTGLRTTEFVRILLEDSKIANYVRGLKVYLDDNASRRDVMAANLKNIAIMLPMFCQLTSIRLQGPRAQHFPWHALPTTFRQTLLRVRSIKKIVICDVTVLPMSFLQKCQDRRIVLHSCAVIQDDNAPSEGFRSLAFKHLFFQDGPRTDMEKMMTWEQKYSLRSLKYSSTSITDFSDFTPRILAVCSKSLTTLSLDISDIFRTWLKISEKSGIEDRPQDIQYLPFTLDGLVGLQSLTVSTRIKLWTPTLYYDTWGHESSLPAITALISSAPPSLKRLSLGVMSLGESPYHDVLWYPFIPLAAECSSLSIKVYLSGIYADPGSQHSPGSIHSSFVKCPGLKAYVKKGEFVWRHL